MAGMMMEIVIENDPRLSVETSIGAAQSRLL